VLHFSKRGGVTEMDIVAQYAGIARLVCTQSRAIALGAFD